MRASFIAALLLCLVAPSAAAQSIVLDPGHGGNDPGAVGCNSLEEAPSVLDVGLQTRMLLEDAGLTVALTRTDDTFVQLTARAAFANNRGADLFVSIHSNANEGTAASGTETWIANSAAGTSVTMATHLQNEMVAAWGLPDRGVKRANFTVLTATSMPAALTELGFTNRCDPDAMLIGSSAGRLDAAIAHARAIMLTLGRDPNDIGSGNPTGDNGVLRGVVFEDIGVGLEDTSRRLSGAALSLDGSPMGASAADTGSFRFDGLTAGPATVEASLAGFESGMRTCEVTATGDSWCSLGLVRAGAPGVDAGPPPAVDAGPPAADAGPPPAVDAGPVGEDAGPPGEVDAGEIIGPGRPDGSGGCSTAPRTPTPLPWLALLTLGLAMLWRRGRRARTNGRVASLLAGLFALGCGADAEPVRAPVQASTTPETAAPPRALPPLEFTQRRFASLGLGAPIGEGLVEPVLSPDGQRVAMSSADHDELWLFADGRLERLAQGPRVGYRPWFSPSGATLRYRHPQQSATATPHYAIELGPEPTAMGELRGPSLHVSLDEAQQVVLRVDGESRVISPDGDRYLEPSIAGEHVVFWGMQTGLFVYRYADGAITAIGPGSHPRFDPSGRYLVFDRTLDDGHQLTASDLYIADLEARLLGPLTETADALEGWPSIAAGRVAYSTPEGVIVAPLVFE